MPNWDQERRMNDDKCKVCGKDSAGNHYSVPACHGCKSFFRRAVLHNTVYRDCNYDQKCFSNLQNVRPRKCRKCRLQKCFSVGMVALPSVHRKACSKSSESNLSDPVQRQMQPVANSILRRTATQGDDLMSVVDKIPESNMKIDKFNTSTYSPNGVPTLEGILKSTGQLRLADELGPMNSVLWPIKQDNVTKQQVLLNQHDGNIDNISSQASLIYPVATNTRDLIGLDVMTAVEYVKAFPLVQQPDFCEKMLVAKATTLMNLPLSADYNMFLPKLAALQAPSFLGKQDSLQMLSIPSNDVSVLDPWVFSSEICLIKPNTFL